MKELYNQFKRMDKAHDKYVLESGKLERMLYELSDFDCSVEYQPSDGFVVVDEDANNAPVSSCLKLISETGKLLHDDYLDLCI